jgi:ABC-2 type transport system permease protein
MSRPVSHLSVVGSILVKDLKEYGRDKLWAFLTVFALGAFIVMFWVLPNRVDETIKVGISPPFETMVGAADPLGADIDAERLEELLADFEQEEGLAILCVESAEDLEAVVAGDAAAYLDGEQAVVVAAGSQPPEGAEKVAVNIGIAFPEDFLSATASGQTTTVQVFVDATVPEEIRVAMAGVVGEFAYAVAGDALPVAVPDPQEVFVVLGEDRVGDQVTPRENFRPLLAFMVLLMEGFVMSSLIAKEIQQRTVTALLVTPATTGDVLAAKGIAGALSGLAQAVVLLAATGSLSVEPALILTLMLVGAVMVSGVSMIAGSAGKDFIGTLFYGMLFMIPLLIPAFAAIFPGSASAWVRVLPSYPLVQGLVNVVTYGDGWSETVPSLGTLAAWCAGLFAVGWVVLKRKVETL